MDFVGSPFSYYWCDNIIQKIWVQKSPHSNFNCGSPAAIASIDLGQSWCSNLQTAHIADPINFNMFTETCHTFEGLHCFATTPFDSIWLYGLHVYQRLCHRKAASVMPRQPHQSRPWRKRIVPTCRRLERIMYWDLINDIHTNKYIKKINKYINKYIYIYNKNNAQMTFIIWYTRVPGIPLLGLMKKWSQMVEH